MNKTELYNELNNKLQSIYDGTDPSSDILSEISKTYSLDVVQHMYFVTTVGDHILGIIKSEDLVAVLNNGLNLSESVANKIILDLHNFFELILKLRSSSTSLTSRAGENEFKMDNIRTMESDVDKVQGYGAYRELYPDESLISNDEVTHKSSQDDALARPRLADMPSYKIGE